MLVVEWWVIAVVGCRGIGEWVPGVCRRLQCSVGVAQGATHQEHGGMGCEGGVAGWR